jgi:hypothetical protein
MKLEPRRAANECVSIVYSERLFVVLKLGRENLECREQMDVRLG